MKTSIFKSLYVGADSMAIGILLGHFTRNWARK